MWLFLPCSQEEIMHTRLLQTVPHPKTLDERIVQNQAVIDHCLDIAHVVGVETFQLADDDVHHIEDFDLEVMK